MLFLPTGTSKIRRTQKLLEYKIRELFDMEAIAIKAMHKTIMRAQNIDLRNILSEHSDETKGQQLRLNQCFGMLSLAPRKQRTEPIRALARASDVVAHSVTQPVLIDYEYIGIARHIEHYEMTAYQQAMLLARVTTHREIEKLLHESYMEELTVEKRLAALGENLIHNSAEML